MALLCYCLRRSWFCRCSLSALKFYSEMTLASSNYRIQVAVALEILVEVMALQIIIVLRPFKLGITQKLCLEIAFIYNTHIT